MAMTFTSVLVSWPNIHSIMMALAEIDHDARNKSMASFLPAYKAFERLSPDEQVIVAEAIGVIDAAQPWGKRGRDLADKSCEELLGVCSSGAKKAFKSFLSLVRDCRSALEKANKLPSFKLQGRVA